MTQTSIISTYDESCYKVFVNNMINRMGDIIDILHHLVYPLKNNKIAR